MGRVWILAGGLIAAATVMLLSQRFVSSEALLTMGMCIGAGGAAAYLVGDNTLSRALWLFGGVLVGAIGFLLGASTFPDTSVGLWMGAWVPVVLIALGTMWTKDPATFLAGLLGSGALAGVYAFQFNLDPQSINASLPIAIGQTIVPLGLGYLAGVLVRSLTAPPDMQPSTRPDVEPPADIESAGVFPSELQDTAVLNVEEAR